MSYQRALVRAPLLLAVVLGCPTGCFRWRAHSDPLPIVAPNLAGREVIAQYDSNHNGVIDAAELEALPSLKSSLRSVERNRDGAITADAIADRIKIWQRSRGWIPVSCVVLHDNRPLSGAEVRLVPERFLGQYMKIARGITSADGIVQLSSDDLPTDEPKSVLAGFYRVEIIKPGVPIPEKYNAQTILGIEVAADNPDIKSGIHFDLRY